MANAMLRRVQMLSDDPTRFPSGLRHLQMLEAESISIIREAVAECARPAMLYSIGKDSSVLLHLALKAFYPASLPFPLLHVDTTWKFREMIAFREQTAARLGLDLIVHVNQDGVKRGVSPFSHGSAVHTDVMKTQALRQALDLHRFDAAFGGARRDEENRAPRNGFFPSAAKPTTGIRSNSDPSRGTCSMRGKTRGKAFGCSRCRTGPSSMSGNTSSRKTSRWFRFILRERVRWSSATAR